MDAEQPDSTVAMILTEPMLKIVDVFRDIDQNFMAGGEFLLDDVNCYASLNHLFANILAHAEDEIVTSVLLIHKTCIGAGHAPFVFRSIGSTLASSDEISLLILLSAAQRGQYGLAGEAALRLGCRDSLVALRAAYEFANWLSEIGLEIGPVDQRLMQRRPAEMADALIDTCLEKLQFRNAASKFSEDYARLVRS